jgi:hypothetical protein
MSCVGGSRSTIAPRRREKGPNRKETALARAVEALGLETVQKIQREWAQWDTGRGGREWQQSEGVVMQLIQQSFSSIVIQSIIPVGGSRIQRLRNVLRDGIETLHTRRSKAPAYHAFQEADLAVFKSHCDAWDFKDGFPCAHRPLDSTSRNQESHGRYSTTAIPKQPSILQFFSKNTHS